MSNRDRLAGAYRIARDAVIAERHPDGYWVGEPSSSALATATAVSALSLVGGHPDLGERGLQWLTAHQNGDGGWGDTGKSFSNISTTMLCRAAFHLAGQCEQYRDALKKADAWLQERYGSTPEQLAEAIRHRYGKDRTFSVPILMNCALAGLVPWAEVPALPFELACVPQSWYRFARMPVVSYALPALIAIGQAVFHHKRPRNGFVRWLRRQAVAPSLRVLERIQPESGGFLEATPLTSFVVMALAACGFAGDRAKPQAAAVIRHGVDFLANSARPDGSWPIDTNLSVWVTTLAVNALAAAGDLDSLTGKEKLLQWLLDQQENERHPYTGAAPGGWGWSHLSGSVPDADDTAGALLALTALEKAGAIHSARQGGRAWLLSLQNGDGGVPTFCRGWGRLPFDRSGADLTAHALRVFAPDVWLLANRRRTFWTLQLDDPVEIAFLESGLGYLEDQQHPDGSWQPLWFGNQHAPDDANGTYGTGRVLAAFRDLGLVPPWHTAGLAVLASAEKEKALIEHFSMLCERGVHWLLDNQNPDGGWGGCKDCPSSIEETALAVEVLLDLAPPEARSAVDRGLLWLVERVEAGGLHDPAPIGFYFAKLWYFEKMYPIVFAVAALGRALRQAPAANRVST